MQVRFKSTFYYIASFLSYILNVQTGKNEYLFQTNCIANFPYFTPLTSLEKLKCAIGGEWILVSN